MLLNYAIAYIWSKLLRMKIRTSALRPTLLAQIALIVVALSAPFLHAQIPGYTPSTEIHPDRSVTFHYKDDPATKGLLGLEGVAKPIPMAKDASGIWSYTTPPLAPEIYGYHYEVDDQPRVDLANLNVTTNLVNLSNQLLVPGRCTITATPLPAS